MKKQRRELTEAEVQTAERLRKIWTSKKHELNLTQESLGLACGWSGQTAVSQFLNAYVPLNVDAVLRLSKALKVHPAEIMPDISALLPDQAHLVQPIPNVEETPGIRGHVPLISYVQAGAWCEAIDNYHPGEAEEWLPCPVSHGGRTYALRVVGDSMTNPNPGQRSYPEGSIIFVDPDKHFSNGSRVIAKLPMTNDVTFKEYREDAGKRYLKPLNPQYQMIEIGDDTLFCGVIIGQFVAE